MTAPAGVATAPGIGGTGTGVSRRVTRQPPLREEPASAVQQPLDAERLSYFNGLYRGQDTLLLSRDRVIEECTRMLWGEQWSVYHPGLGKWYDMREFLGDEEQRWRQHPVSNRLLRWFMLWHARMTENPPILTFLPGPDAKDADLAEVLDVAGKLAWRDAGLEDALDRMFAWMLPAGSAHILLRIDPQKGEWQPLTADAAVPMLDASGQIMGMQPMPNVPVDEQGNALVAMTPQGVQPLGEPVMQRTGALAADVLSPLEVRGEWGPTPWHMKSWHATECWYTTEELYTRYGVEVDPASTGGGSANNDALRRMNFGTGGFGAQQLRGAFDASSSGAKDLIRVRSFWVRPNNRIPFLAETPDNPGGRYIVVTDDQVLYDGPRPAAYPYTSPISRFDFVRLPGRPGGSSPQEALNGPQRSYNKQRAQIMEHGNLTSNPKFVLDSQSGIQQGDWTNEAGTGVEANVRDGVPPVQWITPPPLGDAVYHSLEQARDEIEYIGQMEGGGGKSPTKTASGQLVEELRFNDDRFLGPTMRRAAGEIGRMGETMIAMLPHIWDRETVLAIAGDDHVVKTITVYPEMWEQSRVNVVVDSESMLPEGRGERRARVRADWQAGAFGPPLEPSARRKYLTLARFPHDGQLAMPQDVDWQTANRENGRLVLGEQPQVLPWYDHAVHIEVHERVMKSSDFLQFDPPVQLAYVQHRDQHIQQLQQQMAQAQAAAPPAPPGAPPAPSGGGGSAPTSPQEPMNG